MPCKILWKRTYFSNLEENSITIKYKRDKTEVQKQNGEKSPTISDTRLVNGDTNEILEQSHSGESKENQNASVITASTQRAHVFSPKSNRRMRQESTSLYTHPITDDDLQDFHQHKLLLGRHPLEIKYNLRSMVVSNWLTKPHQNS